MEAVREVRNARLRTYWSATWRARSAGPCRTRHDLPGGVVSRCFVRAVARGRIDRMPRRNVPIAFASQHDAPSIAVMSRDLVEHGLGWEYRRERIAGMIADRDTAAIVTRDGPHVAGFAFMSFGAERAHLVLLAVRPSHQRQGLAHRMIAWLTDTALVAGMASMHVELRVSNHAGLAFYRSEGFAESLRVPGYYRGRETAIRMLRLLRAPSGPVPAWRPPTFDGRTP